MTQIRVGTGENLDVWQRWVLLGSSSSFASTYFIQGAG
jgi:hypothetical protein